MELLIIFILCIAVYLIAGALDIMEAIVEFSVKYEKFEVDEIITTSIFFALMITVFAVRRWLEYRRALQEIRHLQGMLPICSACKKIRDEAGTWHQIESYVRDHSEAQFSHSICPDCNEKLYPSFVKKRKEDEHS